MRLILSIFLFLVALTAPAALITNQSYTIQWTASTNVFTGTTNVSMQPDGNVILVSNNPGSPAQQWTFGGACPAAKIVAGNPNYVAITNLTITVMMQPPIFCTVIYTNAHGASTPLFSIGGLQAPPTSPPVTTSVGPSPAIP